MRPLLFSLSESEPGLAMEPVPVAAGGAAALSAAVGPTVISDRLRSGGASTVRLDCGTERFRLLSNAATPDRSTCPDRFLP